LIRFSKKSKSCIPKTFDHLCGYANLFFGPTFIFLHGNSH